MLAKQGPWALVKPGPGASKTVPVRRRVALRRWETRARRRKRPERCRMDPLEISGWPRLERWGVRKRTVSLVRERKIPTSRKPRELGHPLDWARRLERHPHGARRARPASARVGAEGRDGAGGSGLGLRLGRRAGPEAGLLRYQRAVGEGFRPTTGRPLVACRSAAAVGRSGDAGLLLPGAACHADRPGCRAARRVRTQSGTDDRLLSSVNYFWF